MCIHIVFLVLCDCERVCVCILWSFGITYQQKQQQGVCNLQHASLTGSVT